MDPAAAAPEVEALGSPRVVGHVALALVGAALLAVAPSLEGSAYAAFPQLAAVVGAALVAWAATLRMPALLAALAFVACLGGFAAALAGAHAPLVQRASIGLLCAAALLMGAAVRGPWVAPLFLFAPLAIEQVATGAWNLDRAAFSAQWAAAVGCDCPVAGFPAGLAVLGGMVGRAAALRPAWPRPSAFAILLAAACAFIVGAAVVTLVPTDAGPWAEAGGYAMVLAAALAWLAIAYQLGTWWSALDGFLATFLVLGAAAYTGQSLVPLVTLPGGLLLAFLASLMPAALAAFAILLRQWLTQRRHRGAALVEAHA